MLNTAEIIKSAQVSTNLWSAAKRISGRTVVHVLFAETKVCQTDVAIRREQNIFRLQVPIDEISLVHITNGAANFCRVKPIKLVRRKKTLD